MFGRIGTKYKLHFNFMAILKKTQNGTLNIRNKELGEKFLQKVGGLKNCTEKFKIIFRIKI